MEALVEIERRENKRKEEEETMLVRMRKSEESGAAVAFAKVCARSWVWFCSGISIYEAVYRELVLTCGGLLVRHPNTCSHGRACVCVCRFVVCMKV